MVGWACFPDFAAGGPACLAGAGLLAIRIRQKDVPLTNVGDSRGGSFSIGKNAKSETRR